MVEGGVVQTDKTEFTECWKTSWKTPYIMRLALSAGIGGLLFGYDTGKRGRSEVDSRENLPCGTSHGRGAIAARIRGAREAARRGNGVFQPNQECLEKRGGSKGSVRGHRSSSGPAVCGHKHCDVLQSHHNPVRGVCLKQDSYGAFSRHFRTERCRIHCQHVFCRSMIGIISCLCLLSVIFYQSSAMAPQISRNESEFFGRNSTCSAYTTAPDASSWGCMRCLREPECDYCSAPGDIYHPGACLALDNSIRGTCREAKRTWYTEGCPSKIGFLAVILLGLYIVVYSPGMGTVPWIVNSEIYPLKYRGIGGGIAAVSNWSSNLVVSQTFLTLTEHLGSAGTFLLFAGFSSLGLVAIFFLVPETKGLQFAEVEKLLEKGYSPFKNRNRSRTEKEGKDDGEEN